jgi:hypothetical protein
MLSICRHIKTGPSKFCPECGDPKPQDQLTGSGNQPQEDKKRLICSNDSIHSEPWKVKLEKGLTCSACEQLLQEKGQSGQSLRKNKPDFSASNTSNNYFTQHWQGEHSLTKSYWINFVIVGVFLLFLLKTYPEELITSTIHDLYIYITVYCIALTVITWQIIGAWRSASNHIQKTKRKFWANSVKALMIFGLISSSFMVQELLPGLNKFGAIFSKDINIKPYSIRVLGNKKEIEISGGIKFGLTKVLRKTFKKYPTIKVIHLNSYGGRVVEARLLQEFIKEKGLITSTNKGCLSACTIAYMGGTSRFIYGERKLGFHRYSLAGNQPDFIKEAIIESFGVDKAYFLKKEVSNNFMNKVYNTSPSDLWFPENEVLFANNIITDIAKDIDFLLYRESVSAFQPDIEKVLSGTPAYHVKKEYYPLIYIKKI